MENQEVLAQANEVAKSIELIDLEGKLSLKQVAEKINELIEHVNSSTTAKGRDRGPTSEKTMTEDHARRIMLGDMKDKSHKDCATELGLSYGQVYSARKGFTFKPIYQEMIKAQVK